MARASVIQREKKRATLTAKYMEKRLSIKNKLKNQDLTFEEACSIHS